MRRKSITKYAAINGRSKGIFWAIFSLLKIYLKGNINGSEIVAQNRYTLLCAGLTNHDRIMRTIIAAVMTLSEISTTFAKT